MFVGLSLQLSSSLATATPLNTQTAANKTPKQLVFIDSSIENYQTLIHDAQTSPAASNTLIVTLNNQANPIRQISQTLKQYKNLEALHFITHGFSGGLKLGASKLNKNTLNKQALEISQWGKSLNSHGDILLYGCNVAKGKKGADFIQTLANITQADVTASNNTSGNPSIHQDWLLEEATGKIETASLIANNGNNRFQASLELVTSNNGVINAFLYGDNIEVGIGPDGAFGSRVPSPSGKSKGKELGYISDPLNNKFTNDLYHGDFFMPGSPEEGWAITANGNSYNNNRTIQYIQQSKYIPGILSDFTETSHTQKVTWKGSIEGLEITQNFRIYKTSLAIIIDVDIKNTTSEIMTDVYYMRTVDPDNNSRTNGSYITKNTVIHQGDATGGAIITATQNNGSILSLSGQGANSHVCYGNDFYYDGTIIRYRDPIAVFEATAPLKNAGSRTSDDSIGIAFKFDKIYPKQTVKFRLGYQLANITHPSLDLDKDNSSTALGNTFHQVYKLGSPAQKITDNDISISQLSDDSINGAKITINNAQEGDKLEIIGNLPSGISTDNDEVNNDTEINLTGTVSKDAYISALQQIVFSNDTTNANTETRTVSIQVFDINYTESNAAESKIDIITPITLTTTSIAGDDHVNGNEANNITIAGHAAANIPLQIIFTDKSGKSVTKDINSDATGNWTLVGNPADLTSLADGAIEVDITSTDANNNKSSFTKNIDKDTSIILTVSSPDNNQVVANLSPTIVGKTDPDATITYKLLPSTTEHTITADNEGNWSFTLPELSPDTTAKIDITATDEAGNTATTIHTVKTPSIPLEVTDLETDENNVASSTTPTFSGTSKPNTHITVSIPVGDGKTKECTTTTDADGNWSCEMPVLPSGGPYQATITTKDDAGNTASTTKKLSIPDLPLIISSPADNAVISGTKPIIEGTSTPGTTVTVKASTGQECTDVTDETNHWSCELASLPLDENFTLTVTTEDSAGNITTKHIDVSTDKLPLSIITPGDKGTAGDATPSFIGTTTPGTKVTVTASTGATCETTADADGNWTCELPALPVGGPYDISIKAEDSDGNITTITESISIPKIALIVTSPPADEVFTGSSMTITGTSDPDTDILVLGPDGEECRTTSDSLGNWSCEIHNLRDGKSKHFTVISGNEADNPKVTILTLDVSNSSEKVSTILNGGGGNLSLFMILLLGLGAIAKKIRWKKYAL